MKRSRTTCFAFLLLLVLPVLNSAACTIFVLVTEESVFFANNEDYIKAGAVTFVPPTEGKFGRVNFGFHDFFGIDDFAQGSMNEKGLAFDAAVVQTIKWKPDSKKKEYKGNLIDHILDTCSDVEQVVKKFEMYNCKYLSMSQFLFADANGKSVLVSWEPKSGVIFKYRTGKFQVATNHRQCFSSYRCQRNMRIHQVLSKPTKDPTVQVREALEAVHQEGKGFTTYSTVYDLKKKRVLVFNMSNFDEVVEFDLQKELEKGKQKIKLNSIFKKSRTIKEIQSGNRTDFGTEVTLSENELDKFVGTYQPKSHPDVKVTVKRKGHRLLVDSPGKKVAELKAEGKSIFRIIPDRGQVGFLRTKDGKVTRMVIHKQKDMFLEKQ